MASILVVDDSPSLRQMLQIILQNSGHDVLCAEDGKQALETIAEVQFDLILSDFNMPQLTGPEFIVRLAPTSAIPVYSRLVVDYGNR